MSDEPFDFATLKMCVRLPDIAYSHRLRFYCCSCAWRHDDGRRYWLHQVPAGRYPVVRFVESATVGYRYPDRPPFAVILPFPAARFSGHLFHEIGVEIDARWLSSELVSFQQWDHKPDEHVTLDGWPEP